MSDSAARSDPPAAAARPFLLLEQASEALRQRDEEIDDLRTVVAALLEHVPQLGEAPDGATPSDTTGSSSDSLPPGAD